MNPYFARIALGMVAILMFRGKFLKSLAVGFTHYTVQTLLIALAGEGAATGAPHLPLVVRLIFFPITMLPERYGILIPLGPLLNSGFAGLVFLAALRAFDRQVETPDVGGAAPRSTTFMQDTLNDVLSVVLRDVAKRVGTTGALPAFSRGLADNVGGASVRVGEVKQSAADWLHSFRASTTEIQNIQDGARYWVSTGKILWGIWMVTIARRGFLGTRRTIYSLCVVPPDPTGKFPVPSLQIALEGSRIKWVPVSSFREDEGRAMQHFVSNVVQVEPRERWDFLITRELQARVKPLAEWQGP